MSDHLQVTIADGICTSTMNRPEARNALSSEMRVAFAETVPRIAADETVQRFLGEQRAMFGLRPPPEASASGNP